MKVYKFLFILSLALVTVSCGSLTKSEAFTVGTSHLELTMDDLQVLGESEISVEYNTYLGIFSKIEKVNGDIYDPTHQKKLSISQSGLNFSEKGMDIAAYKLVQDYPAATYFQVVYHQKEVERLFLGTCVKSVARVRAYSFK